MVETDCAPAKATRRAREARRKQGLGYFSLWIVLLFDLAIVIERNAHHGRRLGRGVARSGATAATAPGAQRYLGAGQVVVGCGGDVVAAAHDIVAVGAALHDPDAVLECAALHYGGRSDPGVGDVVRRYNERERSVGREVILIRGGVDNKHERLVEEGQPNNGAASLTLSRSLDIRLRRRRSGASTFTGCSAATSPCHGGEIEDISAHHDLAGILPRFKLDQFDRIPPA